MPATYEKIQSTTLGSAQSSITFSSISSGYTDLRLIVSGKTSSDDEIYIQLNSDTGSNYSLTLLYGDGASAASARSANQTKFKENVFDSANPSFFTMDLFSYAGSTFKTALFTSNEDQNGSGYVRNSVQLWRSTSAVNSIYIFPASANFAIGTTATLYGILKA